MTLQSTDQSVPVWSEWCLAIVFGTVLSAFVWRTLLDGGGIVGGDTYPYFFPQKMMLSEAFSRGELPLWNDRTSLGYPMHAESQSGLFYPTNQVLYRLFPINTAYSLSVILHYAAAYVMTWRFSRTQLLSPVSSYLAAMIFVYGWFPARLSLEWSIIGGVWFPACLWMTDRVLERPTFQRKSSLAICFAVHLLAGHFTLAFVTELTCLGYALLAAGRPKSATYEPQRTTMKNAGSYVVQAIFVAVFLASIQLIPTYELRQMSQRDGTNPAFNPAYGHMPPIYLTQLVASWWYWHTPEMVLSREMMRYPYLMSTADSNQVEAHLYVGLIPLFSLLWLLSATVRKALQKTTWKIWAVMAIAGVLYAFGWFVPLTKNLPGFGFFMGPGRYTIITSLALSLIFGQIFDAVQRRNRRGLKLLVAGLTGAITLPDLLKSAEYPVCDAQIVAVAPIEGLETSQIQSILKQEEERSPVRLLAPGANIGNLFGVSSVPQYLGLGPGEYFSEEWKVQTGPADPAEQFPTAEQLSRLKKMSVTHILTTEQVNHLSEQCELVYDGPDSFLNRVWGRGNDPCYLYRLKAPEQRLRSDPQCVKSWILAEKHPGVIEFTVEVGQDCEVEWQDLMFPGWKVLVDGKTEQPEAATGFGRRVKVTAGRHHIRWEYSPASFFAGTIVSLITAGVVVIGVVRERRGARIH